MGENAIPILESFGGLETDTERTSRTPGRASLCINMRVGGQGRTLRKMQGASRWVNDQMNSANANVLGFFQFKDRGLVRFDVAKVPTDYFVTREGGPVWDKAHTVTSSTGVPRFVTANGKLYVVDGQDSLFWDGTGTGTARFSNWFRLRGPTSGTVGPNNVDSPATSLIESSGLTDLTPESDYEVGFFFRDSGNETKKSAPSAILQIRTGTAATELQIRIDTGYAGRAKGAATTADTFTHGHHPIPTEVAALGDTGRIAAIMSKAGVPGVWYPDDTAGSDLDAREIVVSDTLAGAKAAGVTSLDMTTNISVTNIRAGDQLVLSPGLDAEEVVRVTVASGTTLTVSTTKNAHANVAEVSPIMSLIVSQTLEPGTTQYADFYGPPRGATGIITHFDSLWTWGSPNFPTRLWFTDPDVPETFPTQNFIDVEPDNPFDPIVNIVPFGKGFGAELLILRKNSVWRLAGNSLTTFLSQLVQVGPSCVDVDSAVAVNDGTVMWGGFEAIYRFDGSSLIDISKGRVVHDYRSAFGLVNIAGKLS